jgi:endonuclease/exonuclease/phosphatase family metal-dependent hydrolase
MKNTILIISIILFALAGCYDRGCKPAGIKVASYNLRMDTPSDSLNAWSYRKDKVKALVQYHDFDIFGTQEGFLHQLQGICELTEYAYTGAGRDDGKDGGEHSAIFYRKDRFQVMDSGNFWLSETPDKPGKGWDATCCNRICSWARFKDLNTSKEIYFFNLHFDHQGKTARIESGKLMVKKIQEIAKDAPVICTGDFNSLPDSEQIQAICSILSDSRRVSKTPPYGPEGTCNTRFTYPVKQRIDYIFVSKQFEVLKYAVLVDADNRWYPSDHQPVVADLELK